MLSEEQELLLSRFADGECTPAEIEKAQRLMANEPLAAEFVSSIQSIQLTVKESFPLIAPQEADVTKFWSGVERRILQEEYTAVLLGSRHMGEAAATERPSAIGSFFAWLRNGFVVGGVSGAAVAGVLLAFIVPQVQDALTPGAAVISSRGPDVSIAPVALQSGAPQGRTSFFPSNNSALEVDWMRSNGPLKVIQEPGDRSPIIWIRRRPETGTPRVRSQSAVKPSSNGKGVAGNNVAGSRTTP